MKFSVSRDELLKPLQLVSGVVERRQTLPILGNVLVGWAKLVKDTQGIAVMKRRSSRPGWSLSVGCCFAAAIDCVAPAANNGKPST